MKKESTNRKRSSVAVSAPKVITVILLVLLLVTVISMSVSLARYASGGGFDGDAGAAVFMPSMQVGDEWNWVGNIPVGGTVTNYCLPFVVDMSKNEVRSQFVITIDTDAILPVEFYLYDCAPEDVNPSHLINMDHDESSEGHYVYKVPCDPNAAAQTFSIALGWNSALDGEYFNGIQDNIRMTVLCEQLMN